MLTKEQIKKLPKGEYIQDRGYLRQYVDQRGTYSLSAEGGLHELMNEYKLILEKKSQAPAIHRKVICEKIEYLKEITRSKSVWHKLVYPYDTTGEFTKILRSNARVRES